MNYMVCSKTVMDVSCPGTIFDKDGVSNHYWDYVNKVYPASRLLKNKDLLHSELSKIKIKNKNKEYDCILGLSGGLDSSYMLHMLVKDYGIRPLVFHVDAGWNSDIAVHNIKVILDKLKLDLMTEVIDWKDMQEFQLAWFRAGVPHLDIPQDHAFVTTLYKFCAKYGVNTIMNGGNISTECVQRPLKYIYWGSDMRHIRHIVKYFCKSPLNKYQFSSAFTNKIIMPYVKGVRIFKPLNYIDYHKKDAIQTLVDEYGWKPYAEKHYESRFTKFFEGYWLPKRFDFDMRKVDYSSLILTGQLSRDEALLKLKEDPYPAEEAKKDFQYIASKLNLSDDELHSFMVMPKKYFYDYPNSKNLFNLGESILSGLGITRRGGSY